EQLVAEQEREALLARRAVRVGEPRAQRAAGEGRDEVGDLAALLRVQRDARGARRSLDRVVRRPRRRSEVEGLEEGVHERPALRPRELAARARALGRARQAEDLLDVVAVAAARVGLQRRERDRRGRGGRDFRALIAKIAATR